MFDFDLLFTPHEDSHYTNEEQYHSSHLFVPTGPDLANFNPAEAHNHHDIVIGNPTEDMKHWEEQPVSGPCAIYAQMFALEELTGHDFNIHDLAEAAKENGWYIDGVGTPVADMGNLLELCGLDIVRNEAGTFDDLEHCLENNGKVVVAVNADKIWDQDYDSQTFAPGAPNHAVEVIGVEYQNNGEPMVILNDSGIHGGRGEMVPFHQFMDAWNDGGNAMVEAYLPVK